MQRTSLSLTTCPILVNSLHGQAFSPIHFPLIRSHDCIFSKGIKPGNIVNKLSMRRESHRYHFDSVKTSSAVLNQWCRRQDSNLRTVTDWDLIPAPLTKLGDSCSSPNGLTRVYQHIRGCQCDYSR